MTGSQPTPPRSPGSNAGLTALIAVLGVAVLIALSVGFPSRPRRMFSEFLSDPRHRFVLESASRWPGPKFQSGTTVSRISANGSERTYRLRYLRIGPWLIREHPPINWPRPEKSMSTQIDRWTRRWPGRKNFVLSEIEDQPTWSALYVFGPHTPPETVEPALGFKSNEAFWSAFNLFHHKEDFYSALFVSGSNIVRTDTWVRSSDWSSNLLGRALSPTTVVSIDRSGPRPLMTLVEP